MYNFNATYAVHKSLPVYGELGRGIVTVEGASLSQWAGRVRPVLSSTVAS